LCAIIIAVTIGLSRLRVDNPESSRPELVFSFKEFGARAAASGTNARDESTIPVHMRGGPLAKPTREPVRVRLIIDGHAAERSYAAKGISRDGPAISVWRQPISPGPHAVEIEVFGEAGTEPRRWIGQIDAHERRVHVVTYDTTDGFKLE
jgi:hypothetical protein